MRLIKYVLTIFLFSISVSLLASNSQQQGMYLGLEGGYGFANYESIPFSVPVTVSSKGGFSPHLQLGYQFNRVAALQLGVIYFDKPHLTKINNTSADFSLKHNLVYLIGKYRIPLTSLLYLNIRGGIGYIARERVKVANTLLLAGGEFIRPVYGLDLSYWLGRHWLLTTTWMAAPQKNKDALPNSNYIGAGFSYFFN